MRMDRVSGQAVDDDDRQIGLMRLQAHGIFGGQLTTEVGPPQIFGPVGGLAAHFDDFTADRFGKAGRYERHLHGIASARVIELEREQFACR